MFQEIFKQSEGIIIYPLITLILFILIFVGVVIWVIKMNKRSVIEAGNLPLDNEDKKV